MAGKGSLAEFPLLLHGSFNAFPGFVVRLRQAGRSQFVCAGEDVIEGEPRFQFQPGRTRSVGAAAGRWPARSINGARACARADQSHPGNRARPQTGRQTASDRAAGLGDSSGTVSFLRRIHSLLVSKIPHPGGLPGDHRRT